MGSTFTLHQTVQNTLLASLPGNELQQLKQCLTRVRLVAEQVLIEYGHPIEQVFFIEEGVVSLVSLASWANSTFQIAMVGPDGLVGCHGLLGAQTNSFVMGVVKMAGLAYRANIQDLRDAMQSAPVLRATCMAANEALLHQVMQTAAFNADRTIEERCVRWLLMAHDRIQGDDILVTHEGISGQLGVRRSGITLVVAALQEANLIRVGRRRITILDRGGLERMAGHLAWTGDGLPGQPKPSLDLPLLSPASG